MRTVLFEPGRSQHAQPAADRWLSVPFTSNVMVTGIVTEVRSYELKFDCPPAPLRTVPLAVILDHDS